MKRTKLEKENLATKKVNYRCTLQHSKNEYLVFLHLESGSAKIHSAFCCYTTITVEDKHQDLYPYTVIHTRRMPTFPIVVVGLLLGIFLIGNSATAFIQVKHNRQSRLSYPSGSYWKTSATPVTIPEYDDRELSDEDEEMIRLIRGPLGAKNPRPRPKAIIIISDTTGVTAKSAVEKSLAQFNGCDERYMVTYMSEVKDDIDEEDTDCENLTTQIYPFVKTDHEIASIIRRVGERKNAIVVYTLSDPLLREQTSRMCTIENIPHVDLLGPMYDTMAIFFNRQPFGTEGYKRSFNPVSQDMNKQSTRRYLSDDYYRRIEAVEFTLKCDDGMNPNQLPDADVVICGVSRTGKTPLSVVLAQTMGLKVANIPLVVDLPPPALLLNAQKVNPKRVFVLTLNTDDLLKIRKTRIERELRYSSNKSTYADRKYIINDLTHAKQISAQYGFTEIDVTGRAVEETASLIRSYLYDRFGDI